MNMKSIVEEGSSVAKAIEKGWIRAGKPQEFKVKVFEEAQKNIFGFTSKPAKIAFFYTESAVSEHHKERKQQSSASVRERKPAREQSHAPAPRAEKIHSTDHGPKVPKKRGTWTPEMINAADNWVRKVLGFLGKSDNIPTFEPSNNYLKIHFAHPVTINSLKERLLFKSFAHLIMSSLRHVWKQELRDLKIIITSGDSRDVQS